MKRNLFLNKFLYKSLFLKRREENRPLLINMKKQNSYNKELKFNFLDKNILVNKFLIGRRVFVHVGKEIRSLKILSTMVGYKLGEFFF